MAQPSNANDLVLPSVGDMNKLTPAAEGPAAEESVAEELAAEGTAAEEPAEELVAEDGTDIDLTPAMEDILVAGNDLFMDDELSVLIRGSIDEVRKMRAALEDYLETFWRSESGAKSGFEWEERFRLCDARIAELLTAPPK